MFKLIYKYKMHLLRNSYKLLLALAMVIGITATAQNINKPNKMGPLGTQVNALSGNFFLPRTDVFLQGRGFDISIAFYYNSFNFNLNTGFGNGWSFAYNIKLKDDTANSRTVTWGDGRENNYAALPGGGYRSPKGFFNVLTQYQPNKYLISETDGTRYYFDNNTHRKITRMEEPNGNYINFNYTDSLLSSLVNKAGQSISFSYNSNGQLIAVTDAITAPVTTYAYSYDGNRNLTTVTDPLGGTNKYTYLVNGPLKSVSDKNNNIVDVIYYNDFSVSELIGCNKRVSFSYDQNSNASVVTDHMSGGSNQITKYKFQIFEGLVWLTSLASNCCGFNMNFDFDADGNKIKETDANGNVTTYTYDSKGNMLSMTDALNQTVTYTYSADLNNITSFTDAKGNKTTMVYSSFGNLTQLTEPGNLVYTATYNASGDVISSTDPNGNVFTYNYDSYGHPTNVIGPNGYTAVLGSDARGNLVSYTDAKGNVSSMEYDILNRLKKATDPISNTVKLNYDAEGNLTSVVNQANQTSKFGYDASNRIVQFSDAINNKSYFGWDAMDNPVTVTNALGNTTTFTYDSRNRLSSTKDALGNGSSVNYDANGNILSMNLPNGQTVSYLYDQLNRVTAISDITGAIANFTYDKNDNITSAINATGANTTASYDSLNRVTQITDPLGNVTVLAYDKNSNVVSVTDRNGLVSTCTYDGRDRLKTFTDNGGFVTTISYDAEGNPVSLKDQNNNVTTHTFDSLNRVKTTTYPDGKFIRYAYDSRGNVITKGLTDGSNINYVYDSVNRIVSKILPDGQVFTYTYDALDRVITASNNAGTVSFSYDALDRLSSETFDGRTTRYSYDIAGRKQTTVYPDSTSIYKTYDTRNRLTGIAKGNTTLVTYQYNNVNQVTTKTFANGIATNLQYDFANRLTSFSTAGGSIQNSSYTYDKEWNKKSINRLNTPSLSEEYNYDNNYRITGYKRGIIGGSPTIQNSYTYDALGNRTSANLNGTNTTFTPNILNQLTSSNNGTVTTNFTFDNNGNLTYDGKFYKTYDAEGRLVKDSSSPSNVLSYLYDAIGRRVQRIVNGFPLKYTYSGLAQIEERDGITNDLRTRTIFNNFITPLTNERGGATYYYHQNELNSVEAITNGSGNLTERYQYDVYGKQTIYNALNAVIPSSLAGNRIGFTGQEYDSANGTNRFHFRNYNPETGTFSQRDLIGYEDGTGMYQYVHNNPANGIDIFGLDDCTQTTWLDKTETVESWVNGTTSWYEVYYKKIGLVRSLQEEIKRDRIVRDWLKAQGRFAEAISTEQNMISNLSKLSNLKAGKAVSALGNGLGKLGMGLNLLDFGIKSYKLGSAIYDYATGAGDGYQLTKAGGNLTQSGLGFTPVGALYNLADFAQEKLISGRSMNDNAELGGQVWGENGFTGSIKYDEEEVEAEFHRKQGDFPKWWKIRKAQNLRYALRNRKPNCPQNTNPDGTQKPNPHGPGTPGSTTVDQSVDPNQMVGPAGEPTKRWVSVKDRLPYSILYENDKSAGAPAKVVRVTTAIEPKQDPATFQLGSFGFNNQTFAIPPATPSYYNRLDCRDSLGLYVDITAGYDQLNNQAFWEFQSIDPLTLLPPPQPTKGFLRLQDSTQPLYGHGFVNFSIKPLQTAVTLDTIGAKADIKFDLNGVIPTNVAMNTIDAFAPTSSMNVLPNNSPNPVILSWGGVDDPGGCGLKYYTLYVSTDGTNFNILRSGITRTDTVFSGSPNTRYFFFVLATDSVGNTEILRPGEIRDTYLGTVLPITWLYFKGRTEGKDNLLEWATANEQKTKSFIVERSLDGTRFTDIGTVAAASNSNSTRTYTLTDYQVDRLNSTYMYYRLRQVDLDGRVQYSNIIRLSYNLKDKITSIVYPNPTAGMITLTIGDKQLIGTKASLYDENGKFLETFKVTDTNQTVNMARYVNGVYYLKLNNKEVLRVIKLK
ncbi:MAG: RHS repeat-associated core domain-containing protein [Chitinophagaceae bacterium]